MNETEEENSKKVTDVEKAKAERGVDSVTDYVEEKEIGDEATAKASLSSLSESPKCTAHTNRLVS
jgi:hypothetical protein